MQRPKLIIEVLEQGMQLSIYDGMFSLMICLGFWNKCLDSDKMLVNNQHDQQQSLMYKYVKCHKKDQRMQLNNAQIEFGIIEWHNYWMT